MLKHLSKVPTLADAAWKFADAAVYMIKLVKIYKKSKFYFKDQTWIETTYKTWSKIK